MGILETGCGPHGAGGELAQWNFLSRILALSRQVDGIQGISIDSLHDPQGDLGLLTRTGRRRLAFRQLRARMVTAHSGK